MADPNGGAGGAPAPPYGLQPPLEQGELEEEKVKGEEEEKEEEEEGFSPPMAVTWIRHWEGEIRSMEATRAGGWRPVTGVWKELARARV